MQAARRLRWVAAVAIAVATMAVPAAAQRGELTVDCPGLKAPTDSVAGNGADPLSLPLITGDQVPYTEAGAEVTIDYNFVEGGTPERTYGIHVTHKGIRSRLTTAPVEPGGHYVSRTPVAGETQAGIVSIVTQDDGVYLSLRQFSSGSATWIVWRIGPSCGPVETAPSTAPAPAAPVEGTASYTG